MTYEELQAKAGLGEKDFINGETVIESGTMVESINGDGSLTLSWKSATGGVIPAGETLGNYVMMETYAPSSSGDGIYQWSPKFTDMTAILGTTPYYKTVETTDGGKLTLYTFSYTGRASTLINDLGSFLKSEVDGWEVTASDSVMKEEKAITVSFDGDMVKSVVSKIADACETNAYYVNGKICIGTSKAYTADGYYNRFVVLGGTRNMAKKTASGGYTAITQRLTIDDEGSIISSGSGPSMTKMLVFDDIYPKMELVVTSARSRLCYLLDETGNKISDGNGGWKKYAKWYVKLGIENTEGGIDPYTLNPDVIIQGKPLGILFQSGELTGREFELSYFEKSTTEKEKDDVSDSGFAVKAGEYRIIMQADGDTLLPSLPTDGTEGEGGLCPAEGQKVTLTNVALDEVYVTKAKKELRERGESVASIYSSGKIASYTEQTYWNDFLTGSGSAPGLGEHSSSLSAGDEEDGYIVTSVTTDLITGQQSITYGTFTPKGLLSSMVDKIESVQVGASGTTEGEEYRGTAPMNIDQLKALQRAGGNIGMVTVNERFKESEDQMKALNKSFNEVKNQADRQFNIWFGDYSPLPTSSDAGAEANYPASDWVTLPAKNMHIQDIYYDTRKQVGEGGKVWRWVSESDDNGDQYYWVEVTDAETLAALEKISDVTSDGIICGGTEKTRVLIEWTKAANEYERMKEYAVGYGLDKDEYYGEDEEGNKNENIFASYSNAFKALAKMLNGGEEWSEEGLPLWLADLNTDTTVPSADDYRATWNAYYENLGRMSQIVSEDSKEAADAALAELARMADDNMLTAVEKKTVAREYEKAVAETVELVAQAEERGMSEDEGSTLYNYRFAYTSLWHYLDNLTETIEGIFMFSLDEKSSPVVLYNGEDTEINGETFTSVWKQYHVRAEELRTALSALQTRVFVGVDLPTPPYNKGDLWRKLNAADTSTGTMMVCVAGRSKGETALETDWTEFVTIEEAKEPRVAIAVLVEKLLPYIDMEGVVSLRLLSSTGATIGDICYDEGKVYIYNGEGSFTEITDDATIAEAFIAAYAATGDEVIVVTGGERPASASKYDVHLRRISFTVASTGEKISGGVEVSMYGDGAWEVISRPTSGVMENLGSLIRLLVFGSGECESVDAAGIITTKNFVEMFAKKVDGSEKTLAEAYLHASVEYDSEGNPIGIAKIKADEVVIEGSTTVNDVLHVDDGEVWIGKTVGDSDHKGIVLGTDGNATFNGIVNAVGGTFENIVFSGEIRHEYRDGDATVSNFSLDSEGKLTARGVTIEGEITATSGILENCVIKDTCTITKIEAKTGSFGAFNISPDGLGIAAYCRYGDEDTSYAVDLVMSSQFSGESKRWLKLFVSENLPNPVIDVRTDTSTAGRFTATDENGIALVSNGKTVVNGNLTVSGDKTSLRGLSLDVREISESGDIPTNTDVIIFSNTSSITVTMPSASENKGKVLYVKKTGSGGVTLNGSFVDAKGTGSSTSSEHVGNGYSMIYVSDGTYWITFYCG